MELTRFDGHLTNPSFEGRGGIHDQVTKDPSRFCAGV
jgi:hypothetical protein